MLRQFARLCFFLVRGYGSIIMWIAFIIWAIILWRLHRKGNEKAVKTNGVLLGFCFAFWQIVLRIFSWLA